MSVTDVARLPRCDGDIGPAPPAPGPTRDRKRRASPARAGPGRRRCRHRRRAARRPGRPAPARRRRGLGAVPSPGSGRRSPSRRVPARRGTPRTAPAAAKSSTWSSSPVPSARSQVRCCWRRPSSVRWLPRTKEPPGQLVRVAHLGGCLGPAQERPEITDLVDRHRLPLRPGASGRPPPAGDGEQVVGPVLAPVHVGGHAPDLLGQPRELAVHQPRRGAVPPRVGLLPGGREGLAQPGR